jgi:hypothetical protein
MSRSTWQRVTKRRPCPVCGRHDWCMFTGDAGSPTAVICARIESLKRCGEGGWLHTLRHDGPTWAPWRRTIPAAVQKMRGPDRLDFGKLAADFRAAVDPERLIRFAGHLGVTHESLLWLGIGWASWHRAWSFPMTDYDENVLGIRLRRPDGRKLSVRGGKEGLFRVNGLSRGGRLLIAEGPTDTAALLSLGFDAVGRPSCTGGVKLLVDLVRRLTAAEVVIVADGDAPGQRGAENLTAVLLAYCPAVRIVTPPPGIKDARAWKRAGATAADVQAVIDAAPVRRLAVKATVRKRKAGNYGR